MGKETILLQAIDAGEISNALAGNWQILLGGIILIIAGLLVILFLKKILVNSVLGLAAWAVLVYVLNIELQFFPTLLISAIFGLPGIGVILLLKYLNIPI